MASLKQTLTRFRLWQQDSFQHIAQPSDQQHHCHCCENDFTGNFCPQCGQKAGTGRITWSSIRTGVMDLWGIGTRSLPYTLWQLLLRPGYLIGDYISGRRQVCFPPIKMLVFVALFVYLVINALWPEASDEELGDKSMMLDYAFNFFAKHYDVGMMFFFSLFIIPTYFIFRFSPRCDYHTLPQGFFIQVFNSTTAMVLVLVFTILDFQHFNNIFILLTMILIMAFVVLRSYYQLFGYGVWSTLWRTLAVSVSALLTLYVFVIADYLTFLASSGEHEHAPGNVVSRFIALLLGIIMVIMVISVSYLISRHTALKAQQSAAASDAVEPS